MDEIKFDRLNRAYNDKNTVFVARDMPIYLKHDIFHAIDKIAEDCEWGHKTRLDILDNLIMSLAYMYVDIKEGRMLVLKDEKMDRH